VIDFLDDLDLTFRWVIGLLVYMKRWMRIERIPGVLASAYEKATRLAVESYYRQVATEVVSVFKSGCILDLGTGPGNLPVEILKRSPGIQIVAIDLSRPLIRLARARAQDAGLSQYISFEVGNAAKLSFDDNRFDMVISTGMLHSLRKPTAVLKEIHRVLKPGGEAWIYDPARIIQYIDRRQWKASLSARERFFLWLFGLIGLHKPIDVYSREQVVPLIMDAGFQSYTVEEGVGEIRIKLKK
jgi:ubiquinone/menaquinone biosynthesis C-methylase UbiE